MTPDASETTQAKDELRRAFGKIKDERVRSAFYLHAIHGYTHAEIGQKLSMSAKAVESAMARVRQQLREDKETG